MNSKIISIGLAVAAWFVADSAPAAVTVQGWWHLDTAGNPQDASGNGRNFASAFSTAPNAGGTFGALVVLNGVGGILDATGYSSTNCIRLGLGVGGRRQSETWNTGYFPPATNYGIECWVLPQDNGIAGGTPTWLFSSGGAISGTPANPGGVVVRVFDNGDGTSSLRPGIITGPNSAQVVSFGDPVSVDTNRWMHLAIVNNNGAVIFYTNGVPCATNDNTITAPTAPNGSMIIGTDGDNNAYYGYLDELRVFTFAPGQFSTNDLLLPPPGPVIVAQPQNTTVWDGGAASFTVTTPFDYSGGTTFQWKTGGTNIPGATSATLYLPTVTTALNGSNYSAAVTKSSLSVTSSPATLTVVSVQTANVNAYRSVVTNEPSLLADFPVDNSAGATVSNVVDSAHNGTLELNATYESRTNRAFGQRAVAIDADGDVAIPANSAYEFPGGNGTIEAVAFMSRATISPATIFAVAGGFGQVYYAIQASADGNTLVYTNDQTRVSWSLPSNLIGQRVHLAVVISNATNITAYVNGQSLGARVQNGFGAVGQPAWIGSVGNPQTYFQDTAIWAGAIDEVAIYGSALPESSIQTHYTKYFFGTNTAPPVVVSQPGSRTLFAGGSPVLTIIPGGSLPISFQWKSNGVPISGATSPSLTLANTTTNFTASYSATLTNAFGTNNSQPIVLTFVKPPGGYAARIMGDNPTTFWRLDESSGTNMIDAAGVFDGVYSSNGVNPFILGAAGAIAGDPDTAVTFTNGSKGEVPFYSALNPSGPFTVEFWAKPRTLTALCPLSTQFRTGSARNGFNITQNNGGPGWTLQMGNGSGVQIQIIGPSPITVDNWCHVAVVWDGAGTARLYVNGALDGTSAGNPAGAFAPNPSAPFDIGVRNGNGIPFNGTVDEVAFYNYALAATQIASHVTVGGLPTRLTLSPITIRVVDSTSPSGSPHIGINNGATRLTSNSDGTTTRNGVMQFVAANRNQITVATADTNFDSTVGTIAFWLRTSGNTGGGAEGMMLFDRRTTPGNAFILHDNGHLFVQANPGGANSFESVATLTNNLWHHIAITYSQDFPGDIAIYIDGVLDSTNSNALPWTWPVGQEIELGASHDTYWRNYNGFMDDFRIYKRILTAGEITQVYSSNALVDTNALVLRFGFDNYFPGYMVTWNPTFPTLQSAPAAPGTYLDVTNATYLDITNVGSPYFYLAPDAQHYFRTRQ